MRMRVATQRRAGPISGGVLRMTLKVRDVYTRKVIWVTPNSTLPEARKLMDGNDIRRLPVIAGGELVGIITLTDVLRAAPSPATSLSVWEINYLLDKITVAELMTSPVMTVTPETPLHEVARLMLAHKIGGLPVVEDGKVVGMITESDIFRVMVGLAGAATPRSSTKRRKWKTPRPPRRWGPPAPDTHPRAGEKKL